jgi:hypothetical protein
MAETDGYDDAATGMRIVNTEYEKSIKLLSELLTKLQSKNSIEGQSLKERTRTMQNPGRMHLPGF